MVTDAEMKRWPSPGRMAVVVVDEGQILGDCVAALREAGYQVAMCDAAQGREAMMALSGPANAVVEVQVGPSPSSSLALLRAGMQLCERRKGPTEPSAVGFLVAMAPLPVRRTNGGAMRVGNASAA